MRLGTKVAVAALLVTTVGVPVAAHVPDWVSTAASDAHDTAKATAEKKARQVCDHALGAAEAQAAETGKTGPNALATAMKEANPKYAAVWDAIAKDLPTQQVSTGAKSALSKAAPASERHKWHASAVDVCAQQLVARTGL